VQGIANTGFTPATTVEVKKSDVDMELQNVPVWQRLDNPRSVDERCLILALNLTARSAQEVYGLVEREAMNSSSTVPGIVSQLLPLFAVSI